MKIANRFEYNENGVQVSVHYCHSCGEQFTVCPPSETFGTGGCLAEGCFSYDESRDAERFFEDDGRRIARIPNYMPEDL